MYRILYRESPVYDPRSDRLRALDVSADLSLEDLGELRFTLPASNPWCGRLAVMSKSDEVVLEDDGTELFRGRVTSEEEGFDGSFAYSCEDQRAYLNDVLLPVYSAGDGGVPDTPDGLFAWYVSQYNAKVPPEARFEVGVNEGAQIGRRGWIYRASSVRPTVWEEVRSKLVDELGGVVRVRSERGRRYIDWLADGTSTCSQRLEFGRNLLDFARRRDGTEVHTRVVPWSRLEYDEPAAEGEERPELLDIAGVPDRPLAEGFEKVGDAVVNVALERVHGVIEASLECEGVTNPETLVSNALQRAVNEAVGDAVEISAYDLHRRFPDVQPIRIGDFVRVTAKPRGYDAWMLCHSISLRPSEPSHTYRLGTYAGTYTSAQSRRLSELNSAVGEQASVAASVSSKASAAVESALTAREAAERAEGKADEAKDAADSVKDAAERAQADASAALDAAERAEGEASGAAKKADEAAAQVTLVQSGVDEAKQAAQSAQQQAAQAVEDASDAKESAGSAQAAADLAQQTANAANAAASAAQTKADEAATAAGQAGARVDAMEDEMATVKEDAEQLREDLEGQVASVTQTMQADYAKKTELTETTATLRSEIETSASGIRIEVESEYAKKTALTSVQESLQTQITQNAESITSTASAVTKAQADATSAQEKADEAASAASAAQSKANSASTEANAAQKAADDAAAAAATAQSNAANAQSAASAAQTAADQAKADLVTAQQNLTEVQNRVGATEEDVAAAQEAVNAAQAAADSAQVAADQAKTDAATAQSTADTAKTNAATAQSTANTAKTNAATAQAAADAAQKAADDAQADVDSLTERVATAETAIEQNAEAIELRALKSEVTDTLGGYYTKAQADAAIKVSADSITQTVSETYQTKDAMSDYPTTEQMDSAIEQRADSITSSVESLRSDVAGTYATKSQVEQVSDSLTSTVTRVEDNEEAISVLQQTADGFEVRLDGAATYVLTIESSNGTVFPDGVIETVLTARVFRGESELTAAQVAEVGTVRWYVDGEEHAEGTTLAIKAGEITDGARVSAQLERSE